MQHDRRHRRRTFSSGWRTRVFDLLSLPLGLAVFFAHGGINAFFVVNVLDNLPPTTTGTVLKVVLWPVMLVSAVSMFVTPMLVVKYLRPLVAFHEQRKRQIERDRHALAVASSVGGSEEPICLYLRPFSTTGRIAVVRHEHAQSQRMPDNSTISSVTRTWGDFETILAENLEPGVRLIALGRPGEHVGAGRVVALEDSWQAAFHKLAARAEFIVAVPSTHEGTMWELRQIASDSELLGKTTLVIPGGTFGSVAFSYGAPIEDVYEYGVKRDVENLPVIRAEAVKALAELGVVIDQVSAGWSSGWSSDKEPGQGLLLRLALSAMGSLVIGRRELLTLQNKGESPLAALWDFLNRSDHADTSVIDFKRFVTSR